MSAWSNADYNFRKFKLSSNHLGILITGGNASGAVGHAGQSYSCQQAWRWTTGRFPRKVKKEAGMFAFCLPVQQCPGGPRQYSKSWTEMKYVRSGKEEVNLSIIICIVNSNEFAWRPLELGSRFNTDARQTQHPKPKTWKQNFKKTYYNGIKKREVLEDKFNKIFTIPMHLKLQNFAERNEREIQAHLESWERGSVHALEDSIWKDASSLLTDLQSQGNPSSNPKKKAFIE